MFSFGAEVLESQASEVARKEGSRREELVCRLLPISSSEPPIGLSLSRVACLQSPLLFHPISWLLLTTFPEHSWFAH